MDLFIFQCRVCGEAIAVKVKPDELYMHPLYMSISQITKIALLNEICPSHDPCYILPEDPIRFQEHTSELYASVN